MTAFIFLLTFIAGTVFGATAMGLCMAAKLGEDDPAEPLGYVDQDGESTPAQHQWKNAGAKAHHAEN